METTIQKGSKLKTRLANQTGQLHQVCNDVAIASRLQKTFCCQGLWLANLIPRALAPLLATLRKYPGTGWSRVTNFLGDNKNFVGGRGS